MHSKLCVICGSSRDTLHIFPEPNKHIDRFDEWVAAVGGEMLGMDKDYIYRNRRICHKHFETKYHNRYGKLNRLAAAVPKLFLGDGAPPVHHLMDYDYLQVHLNPGPGDSMETGLLNSYGDHNRRFKTVEVHADVFSSEASSSTHPSPDNKYSSHEANSESGEDYDRTLNDWRRHVASFPMTDDGEDNHNQLFGCMQDYQDSEHKFQKENNERIQESEVDKAAQQISEECQQDDQPTDNANTVENLIEECEVEEFSDCEEYIHDQLSPDDYDIEIEYPENEWEEVEDGDDGGPIIHIFAVDPELDSCCSSSDDETENVETYLNGGTKPEYEQECDENSEIDESQSKWEYTQGELPTPEGTEKNGVDIVSKEQMSRVDMNVQSNARHDDDSDAESVTSFRSISGSSSPSDISTESDSVSEAGDKVTENNNVSHQVYEHGYSMLPDNAVSPSQEDRNVIEDSTQIPTVLVNVDTTDSVQVVTRSVALQEKDIGVSNLKEELPHVKDLNKFLFEKISSVHSRGTASRNVHKSHSLPQSPFNDTNILDERTSISYDDLNLNNFTNINFDVDLKGNISSELDKNVVNEIGIARSNKISEVRIEDACENYDSQDNLSEEEMEFDEPVSTIREEVVLDLEVNDSVKNNSQHNTSLLEFCIERPKINTCLGNVTVKNNIGNSNIRTITSDAKADEDFVDVESFSDTVAIPVLQANNLNTLLEQFEESEKFNKVVAKSAKTEHKLVDSIEEENAPQKWHKINGLVNGNRIQDAAAQWNKNKIRKILMSPGSSSSNQNINSSTESVQSDHDYCSPVKKQNGKGPDVVQYNTRYKQASQHNKKSLLKPDLLKNIENCQSVNNSPEKRIDLKKTKIICDNLSARNILNNKKTDVPLISDVYNSPASVAVNSNHRKKHSEHNFSVSVKNESDTLQSTSYKCRNSESSNDNRGRIKLTIKNKSKVILNIDSIKAHEDNSVNIRSENVGLLNDISKVRNDTRNNISCNKIIQRSSSRSLLKVIKTDDVIVKNNYAMKDICVKQENFILTPPKNELLISPCDQSDKNNAEICEYSENPGDATQKTGPVKKKLNLQEYMKRREVQSCDHSRVTSPISVIGSSHSSPAAGTHYDIVSVSFEKPNALQSSPSNRTNSLDIRDIIKQESDTKTSENQVVNKKIYDPIMEATRKVLQKQIMKKSKAEALRKKEEDIVMSQIPKVECLDLKPLISESEMLKYTKDVKESTNEEVRTLSATKPQKTEERIKNSEFEEIVMVSIGVNTEPIESDMQQNDIEIQKIYRDKEETNKKQLDEKHGINFRIKKPENVIKKNVFETSQRKSEELSPNECKNKANSHERKENSIILRSHNDNSGESLETHRRPNEKSQQADGKCSIDENRYKTITATLKKVQRSDVKITSNSLFASIQDVVKKAGPQSNEEDHNDNQPDHRHSKEKQITKKTMKYDHRNKNEPVKELIKFTIVRETNTAEHGEDKVILHLRKDRPKPSVQIAQIQTNTDDKFAALIDLLRNKIKSPIVKPKVVINNNCQTLTQEKLMRMANGNARKRNDSDMSMSSDGRVSRGSNHSRDSNHSNYGLRRNTRNMKRRSRSRKRSLSRDRYQSKVCGRSRMRSISRDRSRSRDRGRSRDRYSTNSYTRNNMYRMRSRSRSPRRNERYRSRSPNRYRPSRDNRSPSHRRERYRNSYGRGRSNSRPRRQDRSTSRRYKRKRSVSNMKQRGSNDSKAQKLTKTPEVKSPRKRYTPEVLNNKEVEGNTPEKTPPIRRIETPLIEEGTPIRTEMSPVVEIVRERKDSLGERRVSKEKNCSSDSESTSSSYSSSSTDDSSSDSEDSMPSSSRGTRRLSRSPSRSSHLSRSPSPKPVRRLEDERPAFRRMGNSNMGYRRTSNDDGQRLAQDTGTPVDSVAVVHGTTIIVKLVTPVEERRIVFVGKLEAETSKQHLRNLFSKYGPISEVTTHTKDNGGRYGFVTMVHARDAWSAVEAANTLRAPALQHYDVGFGGRRAFCRHRYADLDGMEAEYSESGYLSQPSSGGEDLSFDLLLQQMKNKLNQKKGTV